MLGPGLRQTRCEWRIVPQEAFVTQQTKFQYQKPGQVNLSALSNINQPKQKTGKQEVAGWHINDAANNYKGNSRC